MTATPEWDRSHFANTPEDLEISEAIRAVERVAESSHIKGSTRVSLRLALQALRADRD
jgi:hypothetical protein